MNDLVNTIQKNKGLITLGIVGLMFIFFSFLPSIDIMGKAKSNGFTLVFRGGVGFFPWIMSALMIIVPIVIGVSLFVDFKLKGKLKENFQAICFAAAFVFGLLLLVTSSSTGISLAWAGWVYMVLTLLGVAVSYIHLIDKNN